MDTESNYNCSLINAGGWESLFSEEGSYVGEVIKGDFCADKWKVEYWCHE